MERAQAPSILAALDVEASDDTNKSLKPQNLNLYYGNLHIAFYYFYQQSDNHFVVARLLSYKRISFATRFLKDYILYWWQQHKTYMQRNQISPMTWDKFKVLLRKSLGESNAFIGHV